MEALAPFLQDGTWGMHDGWGWWMLFGWVWMIILWGLVVWAVIYLVQRLSRPNKPPQEPRGNALAILEEHCARGEITDEEFEMRRRRISERGRD